jgi:peptidoglycan/LPS O-acetylase OafA/YrhL
MLHIYIRIRLKEAEAALLLLIAAALAARLALLLAALAALLAGSLAALVVAAAAAGHATGFGHLYLLRRFLFGCTARPKVDERSPLSPGPYDE